MSRQERRAKRLNKRGDSSKDDTNIDGDVDSSGDGGLGIEWFTNFFKNWRQGNMFQHLQVKMLPVWLCFLYVAPQFLKWMQEIEADPGIVYLLKVFIIFMAIGFVPIVYYWPRQETFYNKTKTRGYSYVEMVGLHACQIVVHYWLLINNVNYKSITLKKLIGWPWFKASLSSSLPSSNSTLAALSKQHSFIFNFTFLDPAIDYIGELLFNLSSSMTNQINFTSLPSSNLPNFVPISLKNYTAEAILSISDHLKNSSVSIAGNLSVVDIESTPLKSSIGLLDSLKAPSDLSSSDNLGFTISLLCLAFWTLWGHYCLQLARSSNSQAALHSRYVTKYTIRVMVYEIFFLIGSLTGFIDLVLLYLIGLAVYSYVMFTILERVELTYLKGFIMIWILHFLQVAMLGWEPPSWALTIVMVYSLLSDLNHKYLTSTREYSSFSDLSIILFCLTTLILYYSQATIWYLILHLGMMSTYGSQLLRYINNNDSMFVRLGKLANRWL